MPDRHAELLAMLRTLKLPAMADTFADLALKAAKGGLTHEAFLHALFEFVLDPAIPPTNNEAERAIRHFVTGRKISGGTRSEEGSDTKMTLATLFGTWRAEGQNPLTACRDLLTAL